MNDRTSPFERSVFINCPFDDEYAPILQAIAFCVTFLGFSPRFAPENSDNSSSRLDRIMKLIPGSKYGIHDLSRCKASEVGEFNRMNMPFELGLDYACKRFGAGKLSQKTVLVLEQSRYDFQKSLSDISGWDIQSHSGDPKTAMRNVRSWLIAEAQTESVGAALIHGKYLAFQEWYYEKELALGSSDEDIQAYPTVELVRNMRDWMDLGQPY